MGPTSLLQPSCRNGVRFLGNSELGRGGSDKNLAPLFRREVAAKKEIEALEGGRESSPAESLAVTQLLRRRWGWVGVLLVLGRGLDKHNTSVVGPSTAI